MRKSVISILITIIIISVFSVANAASASINLGASSDKVKAGDVFTVSIVGTADNNIAGLEASIEYDQDKLEIENKAVGTGFYDYPAGDNGIAIGAENKDALSKTVTLYTFTFKVLEGVKTGETVISFKDIKLALVNEKNEQEEVKVANESIEIGIEEIKVEEPEDENKIEENKTENPANVVDNTNRNVANTNKGDNKLPQTGIEEVSVIAIAVLAVVAVVSYASYRKYKNI